MTPPDKWWLAFSNPELSRLIRRSLEGNLGLRQAWSRMRQAGFLFQQSKSDLYPGLEAQASKSYTRQHRQNPPLGGEQESSSQSASLGLTTRYEIDLWGRIRARKEARSLEWNATRQELQAAALSLSGQVAAQWIGLISLETRIGLLQKQRELRRQLLELTRYRFANGQANGVDVLQQQESLALVHSRLPDLRSGKAEALHGLKVLLGLPPEASLEIKTRDLPDLPRVPQPGLPADLLSRRPDIQASWLRLLAADWEVSASRAARLPRLTLSADPRLFADKAKDLLNNWLLELAGSLSVPLVDGGERILEVKRRQAVAEERLAAYRETVLTALQEVENALVRISENRNKRRSLAQELEAARQSLRQFRYRYSNGIATYFDVLSQRIAVLELQRGLLQAKTDGLLRRIDLYKALGGDWPESLLSRQNGSEHGKRHASAD